MLDSTLYVKQPEDKLAVAKESAAGEIEEEYTVPEVEPHERQKQSLKAHPCENQQHAHRR